MYKEKSLSEFMFSEFEISNTMVKAPRRSPRDKSNQDKRTCIDLVSPGLLKIQSWIHSNDLILSYSVPKGPKSKRFPPKTIVIS